MIFPVTGDRVRLILSFGQSVEGICEFWNQYDDKNVYWTCTRSIVNLEEKFMIKQKYVSGFVIIKEVQQTIKKIIVADDLEIDEPVYDPDLRLKKLVDLRLMKSQLEKEEVKKHIHRADVGGVKKVEYVIPSFKEHSGK